MKYITKEYLILSVIVALSALSLLIYYIIDKHIFNTILDYPSTPFTLLFMIVLLSLITGHIDWHEEQDNKLEVRKE